MGTTRLLRLAAVEVLLRTAESLERLGLVRTERRGDHRIAFLTEDLLVTALKECERLATQAIEDPQSGELWEIQRICNEAIAKVEGK